MTTIYDELRADHDVQRRLVDLLTKTSGDSEGRAELFERLSDALSAHADAEERYFYVPLMEHDMTQGKSRHSIAEHHEIDELVEKLADMDRSSPGWLTTARHLAERVEHHLAEEEREIFPVSGKVLSDNEKTELGKRYREAMDEATQPAQ